jgi:amino acid transporter
MSRREESQSDADGLSSMGYSQELDRRISGFSNFAISLSIICILAGGLTSFHLGFSATGGASIGLGWPLSCIFSFVVAATMAQLASAFPTAGGLYHWSAILGGRGWGWLTAWLNLSGLVTVLAAINVGLFSFALAVFERMANLPWSALSPDTRQWLQALAVIGITASQGFINHRGIKWTTRLTDFSGYLIMVVASVLTFSLFLFAKDLDWSRLVTVSNFSGPQGGDIWPETDNVAFLFCLGLLLPAYTITGFDASAHTSEETIAARYNVPRGIVRSVIVSGLFGWLMLMAIVLAMPSLEHGAKEGANVFFWVLKSVLPFGLEVSILLGVVVAQYICGLATVTSASRMMYAFARDGGLPWSSGLKRVCPRHLTPVAAIWTTVLCTVAFTLYTPVYSTITVVSVILLYLSYIVPAALGFWMYGRTWRSDGPWTLGRMFKPLCLIAVIGSFGLIWVGTQPPNNKALDILGLMAALMGILWFGLEKKRFKGPPIVSLKDLAKS